MHETPAEVEELQALLDRSYASAGEHLLSIHTPDWRVSASDLVDLLKGMVVLNLATVNSRGEPFVGAVDGHFFRGKFYFGSSRDSLRAKHIARNPAVSAAHTRGEELSVVAHGTAHEVDTSSPDSHGYRDYIAEIYGSDGIEEFWRTALYWWLEPRRMYALAPKVEKH
jgi:uncharacterized pyridoxamine 5'-phosphate oxidase family protein